MGSDTRNSLHNCLVHFLGNVKELKSPHLHSTELYRVCLSSLRDPNNAAILAGSLKEIRQIHRNLAELTTLVRHGSLIGNWDYENEQNFKAVEPNLGQSFDKFIISALYETLDRKSSFVEELLSSGMSLLQRKDYKAVSAMFGSEPLTKLKPLLLALAWDMCDNHESQARMLEELSYNPNPNETFIRSMFGSIRDQVVVGRWCVEHVKPLLKETWNSSAAATVTSSRSTLHVILTLECIEKLGQDKVLGLMFNNREIVDANELPLSEAPSIDQGKDIVTFCSAMVILNIISWLKCRSDKSDKKCDGLVLAGKHLCRVFPLINRARVMATAFSTLIHALKQHKNALTLDDCDELVTWFEKKIKQFDIDETSLSLGHFDTVKIFRDLSADAPDHKLEYVTVRETVLEAQWRMNLLKALTGSRKQKKKRCLMRIITTSPLPYLCATPQDMLRLCLISGNTDKATETLERYQMETTHLARVVEFQNDYVRCIKELEKFGATLKKQHGLGFQSNFTPNTTQNLVQGSRQPSPESSKGARTASMSSTSSSITSTISTVSRRTSMSAVPVSLRSVVAAASKSAERSRVPAIVSKLTSTLAKDQLMIECETLQVDKEVLIARILSDLGCNISTPKTVGLQLLALALDRLKDNPLPDSPIETYIKKLHSVMRMLDAKPYPGITVATSSPKQYLNSIYPCISHDVLYDLLEFNEDQAVTYNDIRNAINDTGPLDVVRMEGVLTSARDVLNLNNYTTFLSTHDKHRDYLGSLISYLKVYTDKFNISLEGTEFQVEFSPSQIFAKSPQYHLAELVVKEEVAPMSLVEAADYLSVDLLQLLVMSSFPQVCIEEAPKVMPTGASISMGELKDGTTDDENASKVLAGLHEICGLVPDIQQLPLHVVMLYLETTRVTLGESVCNGMDLVRILTASISHHKAVSLLSPARFNPLYLLGLLFQDDLTSYTAEDMETQLKDTCRSWLGTHAYISTDSTQLHLSLHPLAVIAIILLRSRNNRQSHLKQFYCLYTGILCEFLGDELATILHCQAGGISVLENGREFYLGTDKHRIKIVLSSCFDLKYTSSCPKCKDIDKMLYRSALKPMTPAFDFIAGHNKCMATIGYMFNALDPKELFGAGLIIDDTLLAYPALQQYVSLTTRSYIHTIDKELVELISSKHSAERENNIIGCHLFGGRNSRFLVHSLDCMVEYNLIREQHGLVYDILSADTAKEIYGHQIPDVILVLALEKRSTRSKNFVAQFLKMEDKFLGLEFVRRRYEDWPISIAIDCFVYFNEVLEDNADCVSLISSCLDRCYTMGRISKILNYLEIDLNTCRTIEAFIQGRADDFTQLMTDHKEFEVCHSAVKLGILSGEFEARLLAEHIIFLAQNDNFDTLDIYNLLENRITLEVCETLCSLVQQHTNNLKIVLQLIDIILEKFHSLLSNEKRILLMRQRLGAQCYREVKQRKVPNFEEYSQLIFKPLILLEQLIMNLQIHLAATLVETYRADFAVCDMTGNVDSLIKLYIGKALRYIGAKASSGGSTFSTMSRATSMRSTARRNPLVVFDPPYRGNRTSSKAKHPGSGFNVPSSPARWVDDKNVKRCQMCKLRFKLLVRKHHCRWCGRVMCDKCAPMRSPTAYFGASVRLCGPCYAAVQEGKYSTSDGDGDIAEDMNTLYGPALEVLSTNTTFNLDTRESYSFSSAPSSELCLYLSRMMFSPSGDVLLPLCETLCESVMDSLVLDINRNYGHVFGVLEQVLKETRICFRTRGLPNKVEVANIYIAYLQVLRRLPLQDLVGLPAMKNLLRGDNLQNTYMSLLDKQYPQLAISLCTTARRDPLGLWRRWGFQCLKSGDYLASREKLEMCLRNKQYNQAILDDIIKHLENCVPSFLAETTDVTEFLSDIKRKCKKQKLNSGEFDECVYYLSTYGSTIRLLQFYIKHDAIGRAATLAAQHEYDTVFEGVMRPLIKTNRLSSLFDYLNSNRGQYQRWGELLSACCKLLSESGDLSSVYDVQMFLKEYINAAKTSILMLRNEFLVDEQLKYLIKAEDCFKAYLEERTLEEKGSQSAAFETINTRLSHIHLQRQILDFLKSKQIKENNIHVFSSKSDKSDLVKELYKLDNFESLPIIKLIRETFSQTYLEIYQPLVNHLLTAQTAGNISLWFPRLLKLLGQLPAEQTDELLLSVCDDVKGQQKSFERILAIMKDDKTKVKANVKAGFLRNAYILAVNKKMRAEILWIQQECEKQGDTQVREFCKKYLEHNKNK